MTGQKNKKNPITYSGDVMWIKISTNIFDDEKIKLIEEMPEGDTIIVIWFKLLATAGRINDCGFVYLKENIPYTNEMLATVFHRPINTVRMALQIFEQFGMISISDTNTILLNNWSKYQSMDRLEKIREQTRQRVAKYRESQKLLMSNKTCQYCGNIATGYDHIVALSRGGSDTEDNKVECCKECNQIKNDKPLVDFLNNYRDRIKDEIVCSNKKLTRFVQLCNVTDRYIVTPSNDIVTSSNATEEEVEEEVDKEIDIDIDINELSKDNSCQNESFDVLEFAQSYNSICTNLPKCKKLTSGRKKKIKTRIKTNNSKEWWETVFKKANASTFVVSSSWCNIDWFIKNDENPQKVYEGKYDNKGDCNATNKRSDDRYDRENGWY